MIISNTMVNMFNTCERQAYYRFGLQLEPKSHLLSPALTRGLVGHMALDSYYQVLKNGGDVEEAHRSAIGIVQSEVQNLIDAAPEETELLKVICDLVRLLDGYKMHYKEEPFKVLETEQFFKTNIDHGMEYGLRLDLLAEYTKGQFRGDIVVIDHKFVYNFKSEGELAMDGQLAKYIKVVRDSGYYVTKGLFNQIRYRAPGKSADFEVYRRTPVKSPKVRTDRIWLEQNRAAKKIQEKMALPVDVWADIADRNMNPYICKGCHFRQLCDAELLGQNIKAMIHTEYQPNTYGYDKIEAE